MDIQEVERCSQDMLDKTINAVAEVLEPLEETPEDYLSAITTITDNMIITAKDIITKVSNDENKANILPLEVVKISMNDFEKEYALNPIKARRKYAEKLVHVILNVETLAQSSEDKYKLKNVFMTFSGNVSYINENPKDGMLYEVRLKAHDNNELVCFFPKESSEDILGITTGQAIEVMGHYTSHDANRYEFQNCKLLSSEKNETLQKPSFWKWFFTFGAIALGIYYFFLTK